MSGGAIHLSPNQLKLLIMNKAILSVSGALFFLGCGIISFLSFEMIGADLACILAVIFGFGAICSICYGIDGNQKADKLSDLFAGEEVSDE